MENKTLIKLEKMRFLMIKTGLNYGFQNDKTLLISQRLDELINDYYSQCYLEKDDSNNKKVNKKMF